MPELASSDLLLNRFYHHVDTRGGDRYLVQPYDGGQVTEYTFAEVYDQAARMAAHIASLGYEPQSKIAIISKNCAHFFMAELAIWMAGHVTVALYPTLAADTVEYIMGHSEAKLVFVGKLDLEPWAEIQKGLTKDIPWISFPLSPKGVDCPTWDSITSKTDPIAERRNPSPEDESLIIYTSGSTGQPKGVLHNFRTITEPTLGLVEMLQITKEDRALSYLPLAHGMDRWLSECLSLHSGHTIYFAESLPTFVQDLGRARPTIFVSVPRLWLKFQLGVFNKLPKKRLDFLLKIPIVKGIIKKKVLGNLGLDNVRFAGSGSAPIPAELLAWYRNLGLELLEGYGMTEDFCYSHSSVPGNVRVGYVGEPYAGVEVRISDEGEILIKSPGAMLGYYKQPELTAAAFTEDGFFRTGDRGERDAQGRLRITGRVKELFKTSKGKYVAPAPIETKLQAHPEVEMACVAGAGQPQPYALLMLSAEARARAANGGREAMGREMARLIEQVNAEVAHHERLSFGTIVKDEWQIENDFLTPTMKIKRAAIEDAYGPRVDAWYAEKQPVIWE